ncbi:alpha-(1,3)-fucosyltransferase B isoform X2 [Drosophila kikkawai]|uniref:Fucosyltransferase n=1 Tax=Drosophila kikkawai TaxID=30033 RepID=A0A6P4JDM7_DROKI|nr:alpha-(1,3)-fucosyltransferase B isoform X2 [Drosophila kikkawai]
MRLHRRYYVAVCVILCIWLAFLFVCSQWISSYDGLKTSDPVQLLWWSRSFSFNYDEVRQCGVDTCRISNKRSRLPMARGVLFYGSDMKTSDFPLPRGQQQIWALLHEESPRNVPFVPHLEFLRHFHFTSTFSRYSNMPLTTQYLPSEQALTSLEYHIPFEEKSKVYPSAQIVFLQTDCDTMSGREDYVTELMKYMQVDSFGGCLKNNDLLESLNKDYLNNLYSPELLKFLSTYKYMIAIENAACPDYITEKFWRPLVIGVVPIYFGSPTIKDWQPNNKSAIYVNDFPNPRALAEYLTKLAKNQTEYDSYRSHKLNTQSPISNEWLLLNLAKRQYHIGDSSPGGSLFEKFECAVCRHVIHGSRSERAHSLHYDCPTKPPFAPLENQVEPVNVADWRSVLEVGQCQAKILDEFIRRNSSYNKADFAAELKKRMDENNCN